MVLFSGQAGARPPPHAQAPCHSWKCCLALVHPNTRQLHNTDGQLEGKRHARSRYTTDSSARGGTLAPDAAPDPPTLLPLPATTSDGI